MRCQYCTPEEDFKFLRHEDILTYEEIAEVAKVAVLLGVDKIRITGGEPLVRKRVVDLVSMLSKIEGIKDLAMTTNGTLLEKFAQPLANAGLNRVNISLDTIDPLKFKEITRIGDIDMVMRGIEASKKAKLDPIKINCVVKNSSNEPEAQNVKKFCIENDLEVRFIHEMNLEKGGFSVVEGGTGGNCGKCNRIRLTANGMLKPCLFDDIEYNVRELGIENAIKMAVENKPDEGTLNHHNKFINIGG
jgi:cyclic pyranopterin phosphate synthase